MRTLFTSLFICLFVSFAHAQALENISPRLDIVRLNPHLIQHISYINYNNAQVPCNGLVYINNGEAVVMDTPVDDSASEDLLGWLAAAYPGIKVKALIVNHFHNDCLGGIRAFHKRGIASYAQKKGRRLAGEKHSTLPQHYFTDSLGLDIGGNRVVSRYFGPAHAPDNIVTWIPAEQALFGGCMIKEVNADKGNLSDADVKKWPVTVAAVRAAYPGVQLIIPGHGKPGGAELLTYTIQLFSK